MRQATIGTGSGFAGSRIEHALDLIRGADLDYLVFETLGERTVAAAQLARFENPQRGYNPNLRERILAVLPGAMARGIRIVTNMGGANPSAGAQVIRDAARELGLREPRIAVVLGDDVREAVLRLDPTVDPPGVPVSKLGESLVAANAYIGAAPVAEALGAGADIVIGGRIADPSLFVGCLVHAFGWDLDDPEVIGRATAVGHLLECSSQVTGGYLADPGIVDVPRLDRVGFPFATVSEDGSAVIGKPEGTGGLVSVDTCRLQLFYEVGDPGRYLTPDVTADFRGVRFEPTGPDRVRVTGGSGTAAPETLKVTVGYLEGWTAEAEISYGGPGCLQRARLAQKVLADRFERDGLNLSANRFDLIGWDSLYGPPAPGTPEPPEVRLRVSAWCDDRDDALEIGAQVEALYAAGPAAGGGARQTVTRRLVVGDAFLPRNEVPLEVTFA